MPDIESPDTTSESKPKKRAAAKKRTAKKPSAKRSAAKRPAAKKRAAKASSAKVHTSGKEKNRYALNLWVTAPQKAALKRLAKSKGTSIVGMLRHALKLPE